MHTTLKAINAAEGRVGGYLVVWGSPQQRDLQGEYFSPESELGLDWYEQRPVLYHHGLDGKMKAAVIGVIDRLQADMTGIWAEAQLDLRQKYVRTVLKLVEKGILGWSSGSLPHLVEVADDGHIKRWPIVEGSLTPTPAEPRRTDVHTLKSAYAALGLATDRLDIPAPTFPTLTTYPTTSGEKSMTDNHLMTDKTDTTDMQPARKRLPIANSDDAIKSHISVASPYDNLDALDMLHGYVLLRQGKSFQGVSQRYANALAHKVQKAGLSAIKADELTYSTQAGFGDEWVPDLWSAQIWNRARVENAILPLFRSVEMPSNPFELPIEGTDPTVYFVPETKNEADLTIAGSANPIPDSKIGSGKVMLNAQKLALRVGFSSELVEDSVVPVLNLYRDQAMKAILTSIDNVLLNGDTATSGNINKNGGTPAATDRYMAFNGLRKLALVTNADTPPNRVDAGAAMTLALLRQARFTMAAQYSARPNDLAWIVDSGTYAKLLGLGEFLTMEKAGALATAQTGQIGFADGAPVIVSSEMALSDGANGKVNFTTPANNTKGTALCVYRPGWFVGYRRKIAVSVDYIPYYDSYQLTATVRLALVNFDTDVAAALYNI
ncbi:MAG: phage major capsid protein [Chloroflexi bacterium]|nr:phage major capsid protein [Chloroflexota bacterium]MCC6893903.1 phage major capsid protein [Anaerolineae bacterium]